ncbi:EF-hand domain-containing protein [Urbifossiella limnaea]|uniref:EF hand n=1 Tax=Urbifossiella limnaea TaxID=2528023 RepID=A0A517XNK7_9BACT|nr:EF-hand domain-containing protein [Urbifossiella limnaea]QDU19090.1 EF hand [Urbifossiella limnaea]
MCARVSGAFFVLGMLLFTMGPIAGQPGGGKGGKGGFGGFPQGGGGFPQGGGGFPQGGGGFPQGGGGFRMQIQPGGGVPQGGGGFPQGGGFQQPGGGFPQGGGGFPQGGGGGGRRGGFDPESQWTTLLQQTGGTDYVDFSRISPDTRAMSKMISDRMGTQPYPESGVMTKDQFLQFATRNQELARAKMSGGQPGGQQGFGQPGGQPGFGQPGFGQQGGFPMQQGGFGGQGFGGKGGSSEEEIERRFKMGDRDGDGKLSPDEASERTRGMWNDYDTNRDGFVSLDEYKSLQLRLAGGGGTGQPQFGNDFRGTGEGGGFGGPGGFGGRREEKKDDFSNVGIRYGKLPPGLPDWFAEYDQDKDGQINMYEWRSVGGKTVAEFRELDANEDGFIAPLELIRVTATKAEVDRLIAIQNGETPEAGSGRSKGGSMAGGGGGKGGFPGFGGTGGGPGMTGKGGGPDARPAREERTAEKADRSKAGPWGNGGGKK